MLRETLAAFERCEPKDRYHQLAAINLARWRRNSLGRGVQPAVTVLKGDWGDVTLALTRQHGRCFAVLNMANAFCPGGAYVEGAVAQEENMYRRTDCHFHVGAEEYDEAQDEYLAKMTRLLSARDGRVYLDTNHARVCIRGSEDRVAPDLGYRWLREENIFPFYELRAAAQDLRNGPKFHVDEARTRIAAQLDTLRDSGIRHAVLGAFGCGAFRNPAEHVAKLYQEELAARIGSYDVVGFALFSAGYGRDNYSPFAAVLDAA